MCSSGRQREPRSCWFRRSSRQPGVVWCLASSAFLRQLHHWFPELLVLKMLAFLGARSWPMWNALGGAALQRPMLEKG